MPPLFKDHMKPLSVFASDFANRSKTSRHQVKSTIPVRLTVGCGCFLLFLATTSSLLSKPKEDERRAFAAGPVISVNKPPRKVPNAAPDPAARRALFHRKLGADATATEISHFTGFPEPLKPVGDVSLDATSAPLVSLINHWAESERGDDFSQLESFINQYPKSVWTSGLRFNLAKLYYGTGYYTRSIATYELAVKHMKERDAFADPYLTLSVAELAGMYARTGRKEELARLLSEIDGRVFSDGAKIRLDQAREGLSVMTTNPGASFRCGTYALANVSQAMGRKTRPDFMDANPSPPTGFTLAQLDQIARDQLYLPMSLAKRLPGQPIPVPSVFHLRCGHYAAIIKQSGGRYLMKDPTFGTEVWVSPRAIEDESSGFFIIPDQVNEGKYESVSQSLARTITGKGNVTAIDPKSTKKCDKTSSPCGPPGMASYRMHILAASLSVSDMPLVVPTAYGPGLALEVTYNQREFEPSITKLYTHFSPQWVSNIVSWLVDSSTTTLYLPGGGSEVHSGYTSTGTNQGYFNLERESQTRLYRTGEFQYERRAMDGSKLVYERAITGGQIFLSQIVDSWGNAISYSYDENFPARISKITAASGQSIHLFYEDFLDPYLVTAAADEADRSATFRKVSFAYDEYDQVIRLKSVTDPINIVSEFGYTAGFMGTLTTPYGVSSFATGGDISGNPLRWLEATDPLGRTERVEFQSSVNQGSISASPLPVGPGVSTQADYRQYRNSFYWSKKAWATAPGNRSMAHLYHWLHTPDGTGAYGVLEMEKAPFNNNIWYNYPNQTIAMNLGSSASPSAVSRVIERHDGQQITVIENYDYHPLSGRISRSGVDWPFYGYETFYDYDVTGVDLLQVRDFNGSTVVQSYSNYINHRPQSITDGQGQTTIVAYNAVTGQVETITNSLNQVTTFNYETNPAANGYRMPRSIVGPEPGATTTFTYDSADRLETATDSSNWTLTYSYDAFDRVTQISFPDNTTEQFFYKHLDLFAHKDRQNRWNRTWYNKIREPIITTDPMGKTTKFEWCYCGAIQKLTDPEGRTTSWAYDAQGRNYQKTYPDGRTESTTYQPLSGRVSTFTDAASQIRTMTYDPDGLLRSQTFGNLAPGTSATSSVSFVYRPMSPRQLAFMTDGTGTTEFDFYPAGVLGGLKLRTVDGPLTGTTDLITYTYDALSRKKTTNIGPLGTENLTTHNFDSLGRVQSIVNPLGTFGHFYVGATGRLDYLTYPNGQKTSFGYFPSTEDNRLQTIHHLANGANPASTLSRFDYTYPEDGAISTWQRQFGTAPADIFTFGYDASDQLTAATLAAVSAPSVATLSYSYQYDLAGNRTSQQTGTVVNSATFDKANRITGMSGGGKFLVSGSTDEPAQVKVNGVAATVTAPPANLYQAWVQVVPGSNILTVEATDYATPPNTRTKSWSVNITGSAARAFSHDTNGNTLSDGVRTCQWDAANRLTKVTKAGTVYEFIYDGLDRRVAEKVNGTITRRWIWDGTRMAEQRNSAGSTVQRRYYPEGEQRIGGADAGNYFYTFDHLGSIREMTDSTAAVRARYDYDPYGLRSKLAGDLDSEFGFTGHFYHAGSDLHLTFYRAYDQALGRWLSADPIGEDGGLNLYGYGPNSPTNGVDPNGLDWIEYTGMTLNWYGGNVGDRSKILSSGNAASGNMRSQSSSNCSKKDVGPIPPGEYSIDLEPDPNRVVKGIGTGTTPGRGIEKFPADYYTSSGTLVTFRDWGTWRAALKPSSSNKMMGRDNFYLHDSKKGFTKGCIESPSNMYEKLVNYRNAGNKMIAVLVNYTDERTGRAHEILIPPDPN